MPANARWGLATIGMIIVGLIMLGLSDALHSVPLTVVAFACVTIAIAFWQIGKSRERQASTRSARDSQDQRDLS
jgi:uncharacterized membrane protein